MTTKTDKKPAAKKPATANKPKKGKPAWEGRDVIYDDVQVEILDGKKDRGLFTVDMAKDLVGWTVEDEEGEKFGDDYALKDGDGRKVRLYNNINNRPWYSSNTEALKQEMLFGRWVFNGEPLIFTQRGLTANGQHQCIAMILAEEERQANPKQWKKYWDGPIAIPKLVVFGIDDDDSVINTLDTGKGRSIADIIFRLPQFANVKPSLRAGLARICALAVKHVWERTGAYKGTEAWSPRRTQGEMMDFLGRHPKLFDAVRHIWEEDDAIKVEKPDGETESVRPITNVVSPGAAAALLYLMATGKTNPEDGYATKRRESNLDFSLWDKAVEFWTLVAKGDDCKGVREAVASYADVNTGEGKATFEQRVAACVLGWKEFLENGSCTEYEHLVINEGDDLPDCGGVDLGPKSVQDEEDVVPGEEEDITEEDPTEVSDEEREAMGEEDGEPVPPEEEVEQSKKKAKAKPKTKLPKPVSEEE